MTEYRSLGGEPRPPTWSERERRDVLLREGIEDVFVEPEDAPVRADRGPKVRKGPAGAAAHVHGGRVGGVVGGLWQAGT